MRLGEASHPPFAEERSDFYSAALRAPFATLGIRTDGDALAVDAAFFGAAALFGAVLFKALIRVLP